MNALKKKDPAVFKAIADELERESEHIELIASENFASEAVLEAQGSVLTNKYAEGYPEARWYNGCRHIDTVESLAIQRAKDLFGAQHVNVQPHSGTQANMAVYLAMLRPGDRVLAMDLACGGHLSHGHAHNFSGKYFDIIPYGVNRTTECLDYDRIQELADRCTPKMILIGASAYPRRIDFKRFRHIADRVGAFLLADIAHIAGLIVAGLHQSPVRYAEFVTTTTHKTLRGPRGGMIMCRKKYARKIDQEVFPGIQGGPLMHVIAAKAVALKEASTEKFRSYQKRVVKNAAVFAGAMAALGYRIVSGGTETHLFLVDLTSKGLTGQDASKALEASGIIVNKNLIPFDSKSPFVTSGIRIGTPAVTTRGMGPKEMSLIAGLIDQVLAQPYNLRIYAGIRREVKDLVSRFPLYQNLKKRFSAASK
ncbi:MAG: serine hydroxymethyltransferase [Candidatus Omnitrophota bacterium]